MTGTDIDRYLAGLGAAERDALETLRSHILEIVPEAEERLSYGVPAFAVDGAVVAGFAAFAHHLSYLPHSGSVLDSLQDELAGRRTTKGSLHFAVDDPLPVTLVEQLIRARLDEVDGS